MVGDVRGGDRVIELLCGIILVGPAAGGVGRDGAPAVVPHDEVAGVVGIDPEVVEIAVRRRADGLRCLAAVGGPEHRRVLHIDDIGVLGIGEDVGVVEGALPDGAAVVGETPGGAGVVAAVQTALLVLNEGVHAVRIRARDRDTDPAHDAFR